MQPDWIIGMNQSIPGPRGAAIATSFLSTGEFVARVRANLRGRQEIGHYRYMFAPEVGERLLALVDQSGLWQLFDDFPRGPDETGVSFYREDLGVVSSQVSWPFRHLPPIVEPLISLFNLLVDEARQGPIEVLAGDAEWVRPVVRPRGPLELRFRFHNPGRESITLQSPRTPFGTAEAAAALVLARMDVAPDPENPVSNFSRLPLLPGALVQVGREGPSTPTSIEHVELAPGAEVWFMASQGVYLVPGRYRAVLLFQSVTPEPLGPRETRSDRLAYPKRRGPPRDPLRPSPIYGELAMELPVLTVEEPGRV